MATSTRFVCWKKHITQSSFDPLCQLVFVRPNPLYPTQDVVNLLQQTLGGTVTQDVEFPDCVRLASLWEIVRPNHLIKDEVVLDCVKDIPKAMLRDLVTNWKKTNDKTDLYFNEYIALIEMSLM